MSLISKKDMRIVLLKSLGRKVRISSISREVYITISSKANEVWRLNYNYHALMVDDGKYGKGLGSSVNGQCRDALNQLNINKRNLDAYIRLNAKNLNFYKDKNNE